MFSYKSNPGPVEILKNVIKSNLALSWSNEANVSAMYRSLNETIPFSRQTKKESCSSEGGN